MNEIPRVEYPRPQFVREDWMNLNGKWEFEIDHGNSGIARELYRCETLSGSITVPFCPESALSGVEYKDFMESVWYKREFSVPDGWKGKKVLLHIGACDYTTRVWINGQACGAPHHGGYVSFSYDITPYLQQGTNCIVINAQDFLRSEHQPIGKQCREYYSMGCSYTRTTGLWQTVWLEPVGYANLKRTQYYPDINARTLTVVAHCENSHGLTVEAEASYEGVAAGTACGVVCGNVASFTIHFSQLHLWEAGKGRLYDLTLRLKDGATVVDQVQSYFGMRSIAYVDGKLLLNNKPVYQRLVLDQGFYPDGIYTAPSDDALKRDIQLSLDMGFNGARLHQKIFEPRFLYHADCMGYLVWEEHANWGLNFSRPEAVTYFLDEWLQAVERDFNSPAIIGWCPLNETHIPSDPSAIHTIYKATKAADATRPVIDTSGWDHCWESDIIDAHDYEQDPNVFRERYLPLEKEGGTTMVHPNCKRGRELTFISEYGGIKWTDDETGWGYGNGPKTEEEFIARYDGLTTALLENKNFCAFCYTQLTDVEQEQNGLYTYGRKPKFDPAIIRAINTKKAAIEG